jgi:hypothetical protein
MTAAPCRPCATTDHRCTQLCDSSEDVSWWIVRHHEVRLTFHRGGEYQDWFWCPHRAKRRRSGRRDGGADGCADRTRRTSRSTCAPVIPGCAAWQNGCARAASTARTRPPRRLPPPQQVQAQQHLPHRIRPLAIRIRAMSASVKRKFSMRPRGLTRAAVTSWARPPVRTEDAIIRPLLGTGRDGTRCPVRAGRRAPARADLPLRQRPQRPQHLPRRRRDARRLHSRDGDPRRAGLLVGLRGRHPALPRLAHRHGPGRTRDRRGPGPATGQHPVRALRAPSVWPPSAAASRTGPFCRCA